MNNNKKFELRNEFQYIILETEGNSFIPFEGKPSFVACIQDFSYTENTMYSPLDADSQTQCRGVRSHIYLVFVRLMLLVCVNMCLTYTVSFLMFEFTKTAVESIKYVRQ